jgi:hypothetical protein
MISADLTCRCYPSLLPLQVWDATRCKQVKELPGHTNRVSSLAWNNAILSSGGEGRLSATSFSAIFAVGFLRSRYDSTTNLRCRLHTCNFTAAATPMLRAVLHLAMPTYSSPTLGPLVVRLLPRCSLQVAATA